ncbi:MAG: ribokinase, partial [Verrucomicrobiota bacterium]
MSLDGAQPIVVIGSLNLDLIVRVERLPGPGETVAGGDLIRLPGGKGANQAVAAARLGGKVSFVGCVGEDAFGASLIDHLKGEGIDTTHVHRVPGVATGTASILVDAGGENSIAVSPGANGRVTARHLELAAPLIREAGVIVLQNEIPLSIPLELARQWPDGQGPRILMNPAPAVVLPSDLRRRLDLLVVNEHEAGVVGESDPGTVGLEEQAMALARRGPGAVIVTRGERGALLADSERCEAFPAVRQTTVVDSTGAGDVFCGALAVGVAEDHPLKEWVPFANAAASLSV